MEREILKSMCGCLRERAIQKGMKLEGNSYDFSNAEVKCWVTITEEGVKTEFGVFTKTFQEWKEAIYTTESFKKLREWLEEHKLELK